MFKSLRMALGFLTILPVFPKDDKDLELGKAVVWFPVVGIFYAVIAWGALRLFNQAFSGMIASWLTVFLTAILNGAIHWDGFADTADGFGGGNPEQSRAIMKDSRLGAFGGMALIFIISGKILALASLAELPVTVFICVFALSRWAMAYQIYTQPSVSQGLLQSFRIKNRSTGLIITGLLTILIIIPAFPLGICLAGITAITLLVVNRLVKRQFGGVTGDILGATNELIELICFLSLNLKIDKVFTLIKYVEKSFV